MIQTRIKHVLGGYGQLSYFILWMNTHFLVVWTERRLLCIGVFLWKQTFHLFNTSHGTEELVLDFGISKVMDEEKNNIILQWKCSGFIQLTFDDMQNILEKCWMKRRILFCTFDKGWSSAGCWAWLDGCIWNKYTVLNKLKNKLKHLLLWTNFIIFLYFNAFCKFVKIIFHIYSHTLWYLNMAQYIYGFRSQKWEVTGFFKEGRQKRTRLLEDMSQGGGLNPGVRYSTNIYIYKNE